MSWAALQETPLYMTSFPVASTATQNDDVVHETEVRSFVPSTSAALLQEVPLYVTACPLLSTATQKDAVGHETELTPCSSMLTGALHETPFQVMTLLPTRRSLPPIMSLPPTAAQNVLLGHEIDTREWPLSMLVGWLQPVPL
jgi:hypothetical protein